VSLSPLWQAVMLSIESMLKQCCGLHAVVIYLSMLCTLRTICIASDSSKANDRASTMISGKAYRSRRQINTMHALPSAHAIACYFQHVSRVVYQMVPSYGSDRGKWTRCSSLVSALVNGHSLRSCWCYNYLAHTPPD